MELNNDKFKEDVLTHLSDQLMVLTEQIQGIRKKTIRINYQDKLDYELYKYNSRIWS